jgi:hypothetical protein
MSPELMAELQAAVDIVERHAPATVVLRIFSDPRGRARVRLERIDGLSLSMLLDERRKLSET